MNENEPTLVGAIILMGGIGMMYWGLGLTCYNFLDQHDVEYYGDFRWETYNLWKGYL